MLSLFLLTMTSREPHVYRTYRSRRSLRLRGHDYSEPYAYHVTWGTRSGAPTLRGDLARSVAACLDEEAARSCVQLIAYCVMPDHVHVLVTPDPGGNVVNFVRAVKSRTSHAYSMVSGGTPLWQRGFYDHIVRRAESVAEVAGYILCNPVRAGLAEDVATYPFAWTRQQTELRSTTES